MENNQTFREMFQAAKNMLSGKDPAAIANNAGVQFDGASFQIPSLGRIYRLSYPDYLCNDSIEQWHLLVILHYLNLADGTAPTGIPMPLGDMPSGLIRGGKFDRTMSEELTAFLLNKTAQSVKMQLLTLGGSLWSGKADLSIQLPFLPYFPVYLNIWFGDEEFPPSARLLVDETAGRHLTIEDAVTAGTLVLNLLKAGEENEH